MHTVVVDEVRDCNSEQGTLKACVKAGNALALDNPLDCLEGIGVSLLGLDLRSGRERDQRVTVVASARCPILAVSTAGTHVKAIESNPPPAPASAWATLSLCCAATACAAGDVKGAFCACACGWVEAGSGLEGVGAATFSDMFAVFCRVGGYRRTLKRMLDYDRVFRVTYGVKERGRRLQMADSRVAVVVVVVVLFGRWMVWPW